MLGGRREESERSLIYSLIWFVFFVLLVFCLNVLFILIFFCWFSCRVFVCVRCSVLLAVDPAGGHPGRSSRRLRRSSPRAGAKAIDGEVMR